MFVSDIIIKPIVPFTGDKLYNDNEYDNLILSLNYFIADKIHKLIKSDYFLLDIDEINNTFFIVSFCNRIYETKIIKISELLAFISSINFNILLS